MRKTRCALNVGSFPCCFIIPPDMLRHLATSGNPELAEMAGRTLRVTESLVAFRAQLSTGALSPAARSSQGLRRQVFNCKGTNNLPGDLVRSETDKASRDKAVNEAFDHAGTTWNFYNNLFGRESVDNHGNTFSSVTTARIMTMRSGMAGRWFMAMAMGSYSNVSPPH